MAVEVVTPEEFMGDVMGDLSSRRGHIDGMEPRGNAQVIRASVPLSEMFGYATDLRSSTQGRAAYTMQFSAYEPVPKSVSEEIIAKVGGDTTGVEDGQEEVRTHQAARQCRYHRSRRSWQDHADRGDHVVSGSEGLR